MIDPPAPQSASRPAPTISAAPPRTPSPPYPPPLYPAYVAASSTPPRPIEESRRGNPAGLVATILVGVVLVIELVRAIVTASMLSAGSVSYEAYGALALTIAVLQGVVAAVAIVLGGMGLASRERPHALAGIGLGGGVVALFGILAAQLTNTLLVAFSG